MKSDYSEPREQSLARRLNHLESNGIVDFAGSGSAECAKRQRLLREANPSLSHHLPLGRCGPHPVTWLGDRLVVWKDCQPGDVVSVVSSRLGRAVEERSAWFRALRATCCKVARDQKILAGVSGTASAAYVERASELFGVPVVPVEFTDADIVEGEDWLPAWFGSLDLEIGPGSGPEPPSSDQRAICVSPPIYGGFESSVPLRDRLAVGVADSVVALFVRSGGNVHNLLIDRLGSSIEAGESGKQIRLAVGENLTAAKTRDSLLEAGAVGWYLFASGDDHSNDNSPPASADIAEKRNAKLKRQQEIQNLPEDVLIHCTRRSHGPWPDESTEDRLADLILSNSQADHSALATLIHIIETRCLIASDQSTRGPVPVVSFTGVRFDELSELRVFRSHRGRWDFEPYGICIRRELLVASGARAVSYASDAEWQAMDEEARPFFQLNQSVTESGNILDWTVEQEWRQIGDVDLTLLQPEDAWVFVPSPEDAEKVRQVSPWPVVVVERPS